jgi:hypothetical protein
LARTRTRKGALFHPKRTCRLSSGIAPLHRLGDALSNRRIDPSGSGNRSTRIWCRTLPIGAWASVSDADASG